MIKNKIKSFFRFFGLEIKRANKESINLSFDDILMRYIPKNPIIFDVGANKGQSIKRFKKIFNNPIIHAFEPIKFEYEKLKLKYENDKNVILNNCAIGEKNQYEDFYIAALTGTSSFKKFNKNSNWIKVRSKQHKKSIDSYVQDIQKTKIIPLDQYCLENNIKKIDLLKIDTQGYEDKVLQGSKNILEENKISIVLTEIHFDNVYEKYLNFIDIEKYLIPNNFRLVGIDSSNTDLFSGLIFAVDAMYFHQKKFNI